MARHPFRALFPVVSQLVSARSRRSSATAASPSPPHVGGKAATGAAAEAAHAAACSAGEAPRKALRPFDLLRRKKYVFAGLLGFFYLHMIRHAPLVDIMSILRGLRKPKEEDEKVEDVGSNKDPINSEADTEEVKEGAAISAKSSAPGLHGDNAYDKKERKGNAGISANMVLKIPTTPGSHLEIVIRADMPMNQLAALSESVKSGNFTFNQDDLSIALRHAANDRITFLKNKENFVLEKDKEQLKLEQAAVAKLNELIENLSAPPKPESDMPALVEDLLKHWFNDLVLYLVTTILGSVYLYLKSRIEELNIADLLNLATGAVSSWIETEIEILRLPVCPFSGMIVLLAASETVLSISVENNTVSSPLLEPEVVKGPEFTQLPQISDEDMLFLYKWMLEEYRLMKPKNAEEKERIDTAKALLKELIRTK
uniref:Uncharacterized protein n=1 Tax=Aegilops tauschii TaxID=37682 RepID=M8BCL5_AEGTA